MTGRHAQAPGWGAGLLGLLLPVGCAGCGADDVAWCPACASLLAGPPVRCEQRAGRWDRLDGCTPPVWCAGDLAGPVRVAVSAWKDHGRADLQARFGAAMRAVVADPVVRAHLAALALPGDLLVMGVPTAAAARRRRGGDPVAELVGEVAAALPTQGVPAVPARALARRSGADSAGLGARDRVRSAATGLRVRRGWASRLAGGRVLLVDDVLTTGASLAACRRVLEAAGAHVVGGLVLASAPPPGGRSTRSPARQVEAAGRVG